MANQKVRQAAVLDLNYPTQVNTKVPQDAFYYPLNVLSGRTQQYQQELLSFQQAVDQFDFTKPFVALQQVFLDESFVQNSQNFLKFLSEDVPVAAAVATPHFEALTQTCQNLNLSLDSLFITVVGDFANLLVFLQEIMPAVNTLWQEQWTIFAEEFAIIGELLNVIWSGATQMLAANLTAFFTLAQSGWSSFWQGLFNITKNTVVSIVEQVTQLVNSFIDRVNSLLKFVNEIGGKIGLDFNFNLPKFDQGGWVSKTGLAVVHQGEFVLSAPMLAGQQATPSGLLKNSAPAITVNATITREEQLTSLIQKLGWLVGSGSY